ncbi:MAG: hypothetical protein KF872_06455 [Chitinophagales bacterium]|nr:hypothetical protein [Chitinophagales bacterium]
MQSNVVHASDSLENGEIEVARFFKESEIMNYKKLGENLCHAMFSPVCA